MNRFIFVTFFVLIVISCRNTEKPNETKNQDTVINSIEVKHFDTTVVDYTNSITVTKGYVIFRDTILVRQSPSEDSKLMEKAGYGESYEVITDVGDWLAVWSRERYPYQGLHDGQERLIIAKRKVFLPKSAIGKLTDLVLDNEDVSTVNVVSLPDKESSYYEYGYRLKDYLSLELISPALYRQKKKDSLNPIVRDTLNHVKDQGLLVLPASQKNYVFKDSSPEAEESRAIYQYIGYIPFLRQYIVEGSYYESIDYTLVDMHTGDKTATIIDFPHFSPDGGYVLALYTNPYETCEDVELYRIVGKKIEPIVSLSFMHWMAGVSEGDIFFAKDGYLYLPVFYNKAFWTEDGHLNQPKQFMRIGIKAT